MAGQIVSSGATYVVSSGVTDSGDIVTDPGSLLIVSSGGTTIGATAANGGTEEVMAGGVASGTVIAGGTLELASGGSVGAGALTFSGTGGTLRIDDTAMPANTISGLIVGDAIDLAGVSLASGGLVGLSNGNVLVVSAAGSAYDLQLDPSQDYSRVSFRLLSDGHGGTEVMAATGLSINLTYDASVSNAPAGFLTAVGQAVRDLEAMIAAPATVNIRLGYGEIFDSAMSPGALGESGFFLDSFSYADALSTLSAGPLTADQLQAYNALPAVPPESGTLWLNTAQERALGLMPTNGIDFDGAIGFSSSAQFSFASGTTPSPGKFYFIGVAEHEITEVMGRFSLLASTLAGSASYSVMDLFRYASAGALQIGSGAPSYFSIDGGVTNLHSWNNFATGNHDDLGDWAQGATHDAFDDRTGPGVLNSLSLVDRINMDVIGWDVSATSSISSGQAFTVSSGVTISNVHVESGGTLIVVAGGTAYGTVISSGGAQLVSSGGRASVAVLSGGTETILSGGSAIGDFLLAGNAIDSGTATSITVRSGAFLGVMAGGVTNITTISSGGTLQVDPGGYASGTIVLSGGTLDILVGGSTSGTVVSSGGTVVSIISSGQSVTVSSGQIASDTLVLSGGNLFVADGGEADVTTLSGGTEVVSSGGIASATTIAGGTLELASGAILSGAITFSGTGGTLQVDATTMPLNRISGFVAGDSIDLAGVGFGSGGSVVLSATSSGSILHVTEAGIDYDLHLDPSQDYSSTSFRLLSDGHGGTIVEAESGLSINLIYDASVTSAPVGFVTAATEAAREIERSISSPQTINIHIGYGEVSGAPLSSGNLGQSDWDGNGFTYAQVLSALSAGPHTAADLQALNHLPSTTPDSGTLTLSIAQQQALGLRPNNGVGVAGYIGFASGTDLYGFASGVVPPPGTYYFIGVVEHEITEVMGRASLLANPTPAYTVMDLFRYASPGVFQTTSGDPSYFSIDGGVTNLNFWNNFVTGNFGDLGDWAPSAGHDAFRDNSAPGFLDRYSEVDKINMNVIGWNLAPTSVVSSGQTRTVSSGHAVSNFAAESGGTVLVESGGFTYGTIVSIGATQLVSNGGSASVTVLSGGNETILSGGATTGDFVLAGTETVSGFAMSATIRSGGLQSVLSGGLTSDTTVSSGGVQDVSAGGVASSTTVDDGGVQEAFAGGVTNRTTVFGGTEIVSSGGTASATVIRNGGTLLVGSGGIARATIVHTGTEIVSGGVDSGAIVSAGGSLTVSSGGVADGTTVRSGGMLELFGGAALSGTTIIGAGGILEAGSGYTVSGFVVSSGVTLEIASGGRASGTIVLSGGVLEILSGGTAHGTVVSSGGVMTNVNDKPAQSGLVDMGDISFYNDPTNPIPAFSISDLANYPGSFSEMVLNVTWAQLEPTSGTLDTSVISSALSAVSAYNTAHPGEEIGVKLRVWGGFVAPDWAKNIDGAPITVTGQGEVNRGFFGSQTIGRFWTTDYVDAWTSFQDKLADLYDSNPLILGISQTAGMGATDEPFVPLFFDPSQHENQPGQLEAGGYTDSAEMLTLRAAIADYSAWSTTPLDFTFNIFFLQDSGRPEGDENFPLAVLQQARNSTRLVQPGNHALTSLLDDNNAFVYHQMAADAALDPSTAPGSYQMQAPVGLGGFGNWPSTVSTGVGANGGDIEAWNFPGTSGFLGLPPAIVQSLSEIIAAGIAPVTGAPADGSALGFIAPAYVTAATSTAAFTGTDAVLLATTVAQHVDPISVTLTSLEGGTLSVTDPTGIVQGATSGSTLTLSGPLALVNTVLARLTDTVSGADLVRIVATDVDGNRTERTIGVQVSSSSSGAAGGGDGSGFAGEIGSSGILLVGGVSAALDIPGDLDIGSPGSTTLLAALTPSAYSTASLTVTGGVHVASNGTAHFTGLLSGGSAVTVAHGGVLAGDGVLATFSGGTILNNGTIEATADTTLGLQRLLVSNALSGTGELLIDAGATLALSGAVSSGQTIVFAPNTLEQFANDPYTPSTLVLFAPSLAQSATIRGFTFADRLVLEGVSATSAGYSSGILTVGSLTFTLSGVASGLTPVATVVSGGNETTISFVASNTSAARPSVSAPTALRGGVGTAVLVPDVVLETPLTANPPADTSVRVTLSVASGTLSAGDNNSNTSVTSSGSHTLILSGTVASVERSLKTLTYRGSSTASDVLSITVSDFAGSSTTSTSITNVSSSLQFDWTASAGGSFGASSNWSTTSGTLGAPPGGLDIAAFGSGSRTVSGGGAVGEILVSGTTTLTGQVTAQGLGGSALVVDSGGALMLAGGGVLTALAQATVGNAGQGLLTLMGGALEIADSSGTNSLVIGATSAGNGVVMDLETIAAGGTVIVGQAGTGTLELLGIAATVSDGGAVLGQSAGALGSAHINGGFWATSGQLTVGDAGSGALLIDGRQGGIAGQATAYDASIGAQAGGHGTLTLDGGELLVANATTATATSTASSSTLVVGGGGSGSLFIENGGEAAVGVAQPLGSDSVSNTGRLVVGGAAGGAGEISIGSRGALLIYGDGIVGAGTGAAVVSVGGSGTDRALFALLGVLEIGSTGQVVLAGEESILRASIFNIDSGGVVSGAGTLSGDGGGNGTVMLATIINDGSISAGGGSLLIYGNVVGSGTLSVATSATITLQATVGADQILDFSPNAEAVLNDARAFAGTISGFGAGDVLDLASTDATGATWSGGVLSLDTTGGVLHLAFAGSYASNAFTLQSDGHGGTDVVLAPTGSSFVGGGETLIVSSGQSSSGLIVLAGGRLAVESGGSATGTTVRDGGTLTLSSGAQASGTTLDPGSLEQIASGYVLSGFTVSSGVTVDVLSGGVASGTTVLSGGTLDILAGGAASGTVTSSGGAVLSGLGGGQTLAISSGQTSSGIIVISGGVETVLSGGTAIGTVVSSGALENVLGRTSSSTIESGGAQGILAGGSAGATVISSGGVELVSSGGVASGTVVSSGGRQDVQAGGSALGTTVSSGGLAVASGLAGGTVLSGGTLTVLAAGIASATVVYTSGLELAASGGTTIGTVISSGGQEIVDSGGGATGTVVSSGGTLTLLGGGSATSTTLLAGAAFQIASGYAGSAIGVTRGTVLAIGPGGTATATVVGSGTTAEIISGGLASATSVQGDGTVEVRFGGTTIGDVLVGSGRTHVASETVLLGGIASGTVLHNAALLLVLSAGLAIDTIVDKNPTDGSAGLVVFSGGMASGALILSGGGATLSAGSATGTEIRNGGVLSVTSGASSITSSGIDGGTNSASVISSGGRIELISGFDFFTTVLNGGTETVSSGGAAISSTVSSGGLQILSSGGAANGTFVSDGGVVDVRDGLAFAVTISSGGRVVLSGGTAFSATVLSGGSEIILAGGAADRSILSGGGAATVSSGGVTHSTTISSGGLERVLAGGTASATLVSEGGRLDVAAAGVALGTVLSGTGLEVVSSGGQASGSVVGSGGGELVSSGGAANGATILGGGSQTVLKGGAVSGTAVSSGGREIVSSGGAGRGTMVSAGGQEIVSNGGAVSGTTVLGGGTEIVSSGGVATSVTLAGGTQTVLGHGTANGTIVSNGGVEIVSAGTTTATVVSSGGQQVISSGGTAIGTVIESGGLELVRSGGLVSGATISGGRLEIESGGAVASSTITFAGSGSLVLDSTTFRGKIAGFDSPAETIDLTTVSFASATLGYTGNSLSGTLTVTDGTHTARLAMLGSYVAANFHLANDGNGGTLVSDPPVSSGSAIAPPH